MAKESAVIEKPMVLIPIEEYEELISLATFPFKGKALHGDKKGCYQLRVGDYRVIYEVAGEEIYR